MNDEIIEVAIKDIQIGRRFRKDFGDLEALARQIERGELLQSIGVTEDLELVFGERRLRAYRDVLRRDTIPARIVDPRSKVLGQIAENAMRKDYTISEKVEIVDELKAFKCGGDRRSDQARNREPDRFTVDQAAKFVGLGGKDGYFRAKAVVDKGVPELVEAMHKQEMSVSAAAELASLSHKEQRTLLATRKDWTATEIVRFKGEQAQKHRADADGSLLPAPPNGTDKPDVELEPILPFGTLPVDWQEADKPEVVPHQPQDEGDVTQDDERSEYVRGDSYNFYPTFWLVTEALLEVEEFGSSVWEPACGDGAISEVLIKHGYEVDSSDIMDRGYGAVEDFFESDRIAESIVTNPDYDYSEEFVRRALEKTTYKVAMLLPLSFLASRGRYDLFRSTPLKCVYVFTGRISLYPHDWRGSKGNGRETYAWFVWQHGYEGNPTIHLSLQTSATRLLGTRKTARGRNTLPSRSADNGGLPLLAVQRVFPDFP